MPIPSSPSYSAIQPDAWLLDPAVTFLNHGSFGACPRVVLERQQEIRRELEREPVDFLVRKMTPLVDENRNALANLIGADPCDVVFVQNATAGVNSVIRSLDFRPGDEILVTAHDYNACRNVIRYVAQRSASSWSKPPRRCRSPLRNRSSMPCWSASPRELGWPCSITSPARRPWFFRSSSWCASWTAAALTR